MHAAADLLDEFADGAFFVAIASIGDAALASSVVSETLQDRESGGRSQAVNFQAGL